MKTEEQKFGEDVIRGLAKNQDVRWFVDANVLIRGTVTELFESAENVFVLAKVRKEVEKHEKALRGKRFIHEVEKLGNIVDENWHEDNFGGTAKFIFDCAREYTPAVRANKQWFIDEGMDPEQAEIRAIEKVAVEGNFFECDFKNEAAEAGLISDKEAQINPRTRSSWFDYARKRRHRFASGEYGFTDEDLVATAIATSVLANKKVGILTADKDHSAIFKQATDNWIWSASAMDCELSKREVNFDEVVFLWEQRCKDLDKFRQSCKAQRMMRVIEEVAIEPAVLLLPIENEVILCRSDDSHVENFVFSAAMVEYAKNIEHLRFRFNLVRRGFRMPKS